MTEMTWEPSHHTTISYYYHSGLINSDKILRWIDNNTNQSITNTPYITKNINFTNEIKKI